DAGHETLRDRGAAGRTARDCRVGGPDRRRARRIVDSGGACVPRGRPAGAPLGVAAMNTQGILSSIVPVHVLAGLTALLFGYVALAATKGAALHRRSGTVFVGAMLTMSLSGALMAAIKTGGVTVNVVAGSLTFYFVATGLLTVRRGSKSEWIDA